jgi:hypothetical protein
MCDLIESFINKYRIKTDYTYCDFIFVLSDDIIKLIFESLELHDILTLVSINANTYHRFFDYYKLIKQSQNKTYSPFIETTYLRLRLARISG